ncbi:MAG: hypothetical protein LBC77_05995 [Spirochaetaceae bacterium]|jgi:hypothetical protein|nr:hypothetical protein [Spirochaetaceae bacterium]
MRKRGICLLCALCFAYSAHAFDYGLELENKTDILDMTPANELTVSPYFKFFFERAGWFFFEFDLSAAVENGVWSFEVWPGTAGFHFDITGHITLNLGRQYYKDISGMIADGSLDGFGLTFELPVGSLSLSAFYTGLLSKKRTKIIMSDEDAALYAKSENRFAPKKFFSALELELDGLLSSESALFLGLAAQLDITNGPPLNNYYASFKAVLPLASTINFDFGSTTGIAENNGAFALESASFVNAVWRPEVTALKDAVFCGVIWSSGHGDGDFGAFYPLTFNEQGDVWTAQLSNLAQVHAEYQFEIGAMLFSRLSFRYFFRTSFVVPESFSVVKNNEHALGPEAYFSVRILPYTDIELNTGFGLFIPNKDIFDSFYPPVLWKFNFSLKVEV